MSANSKTLSIRLAAVGGEQVRGEFEKLGKRGQRALDDIDKAAKRVPLSIKAVDAAARTLNSTLKQAAGLLGAYASVRGLMRLSGFLVSTNREFEKLHASLTTVTGSIKGADDAFKMIEDFASHTPFSVEQLTESFIKLKALGLEPSADALRSYGNTASAMGKDLMQFVNAVANATTGRFMNLKDFGINAEVQGDKVAFTFNKVKTVVNKNASEIESYLRQIGKVNFAGAMTEQMDILDGIFSNIKDNVSHIVREIGKGGFTAAIHDIGVNIRDATGNVDEAAHAFGETLGTAVRFTAEALSFLYPCAKLAAEGLKELLIAKAISKSYTTLRNVMVGSAGIVTSMRTMNNVSTATAVRMVALEGATKLATVAMAGLRSALTLVGGSAGLIVLLGIGLYKLVEGHDAASIAARHHSAELKELREQAKQTKDGIESLNQASHEEAIARTTKALKQAQKDVADVTQQIKYGFVGSNWGGIKQVVTFQFGLMRDVHKLQVKLQSGKMSIKEYEEAIWHLVNTKYPDFHDQADILSKRILSLNASTLALKRHQKEMDALQNGTKHQAGGKANASELLTLKLTDKQIERINQSIESLQAESVALQRVVAARKQGNEAVQRALLLNEQEKTLMQLGIDMRVKQGDETLKYANRVKALIAHKQALQQADNDAIETAKRHQQAVIEITRAFDGLKSESQQMVMKANAWRDAALSGLDETKQGYSGFANEVEAVYQDRLSQARTKDLENAKRWQDGVTRGLQHVVRDAQDTASMVENAITNAFSNMESALTEFVMHGKLDFKSLADSMIADIVRIQIRKNVSAPLASALGSVDIKTLFGAAHTGGVIGRDSLSQRAVNPFVFASAPKFHSGGVVGDEVPIIAKRGETVFTKGQMQLLGAGLSARNASSNVIVHVHNNVQNVQTKTQSSQSPNGDVRLDIVVEHIEQKLARNVTRGEGLSPVLEKRYGLNPAMGSYR